MAEINRIREKAIQRVMREMGRDREEAEHFVDFIEGRVLDFEVEEAPSDADEMADPVAE